MADAEFVKRAYPSDTISVAQMDDARAAFTRELEAAVRGRARQARRLDVDRAGEGALSVRAVPRLEPLRPELVRRRRPHDVARAERGAVHAERLHDVHHAGGRRRLEHRPRAARRAPTGSTSAARSGSTRRARSRSTRTTRAARRSGSARARRTSAPPAASRASASTSRRTAARRGPGRSASPSSRARASARSSSSPATRTRSTSPRRRRSAATRRSAARASRARCRGSRSGASTSRRTAARRGASSTTARRRRATCTGDATEFANGGVCSPRGVRDIAFDPSNSGHPVRGLVRARRLALDRRGRDLGADQAVDQRGDHPVAAGDRGQHGSRAAPRACTCTRATRHQNPSRVYRSDSVATGVPVFVDLANPSTASPGYAYYNLCTAQCWYDLFVYTPKGHPDVFYAGGSYAYDETADLERRAVILSTDAGATGTDMTMDSTDPIHPNALHPDQHYLVTVPGKPFEFIEANDGGVMRSNGSVRRRLVVVRHARSQPDLARALQAAALAGAEAAGVDEQRAADAPVPEPVGEPARRRHAAGRDAGQRHVGEPRAGAVGEHDDRRRRPVRLRRRRSRSSASTPSRAARST